MNEQEKILLKHYLETLLMEVARMDEREQSEDTASIRQLVVRVLQIVNKKRGDHESR